MPHTLSPLDQPSNHAAAFIVRWRLVMYLLVLLAAIAIASIESRVTAHRPAPTNVESDD